MLKELLNRLKWFFKRKPVIENNNATNKDTLINEEQVISEKKDFTITTEEEKGIYRIEISDYLKTPDFDNKIAELGISSLTSKISTCLIWNSSNQKIQKGIFYILEKDAKLFNVFLDEDDIRIDVRIKLGDITEERILSYNLKNRKYRITSFKHDKIGSTFYNKYYPESILPKGLILSNEEALDVVGMMIASLKELAEISLIVDISILEEDVLTDLREKKRAQELSDNESDTIPIIEDNTLDSFSKSLTKKL